MNMKTREVFLIQDSWAGVYNGWKICSGMILRVYQKKKPKRREVGIFFNIFTTTKRKVMNFHFILDSCSLFDNMSHLKKWKLDVTKLPPTILVWHDNVLHPSHLNDMFGADMKFVKKFTRPNFWSKEYYTLKMRKLRLFSQAIKQHKCIIINILVFFWLKLDKMCKFFNSYEEKCIRCV